MRKKDFIAKIDPLYQYGIAHRGLHTKDFTENGINAFKNAIDNNVAFEYDIHLTKDNDLVVCHDSELERTTGKKGIIEDLTVKEIKENYKLLDGSTIMTLKELLEMTDEKVPQVIELKVYNKNYKPLAKRTIEELKNVKDKSKFLIISFDPRALFPFKKKYGFMRQLLVCKSHEYTYMFRHFFESLDVETILLKEKRIQKYQKKHYFNVWTVEDEKTVDEVLPFTDTITFQHVSKDYVSEKLKTK